MLGTGEEAGKHVAARLGGVGGHGERQRHGCAGQRPLRWATQARGQRLAESVCRQTLWRENENVAGVDVILLNAVGDKLNQRRGLSRAGCPHNHKRFAHLVIENTLLLRIERMAHERHAWRYESPVCGHGVNVIAHVGQSIRW